MKKLKYVEKGTKDGESKKKGGKKNEKEGY